MRQAHGIADQISDRTVSQKDLKRMLAKPDQTFGDIRDLFDQLGEIDEEIGSKYRKADHEENFNAAAHFT